MHWFLWSQNDNIHAETIKTMHREIAWFAESWANPLHNATFYCMPDYKTAYLALLTSAVPEVCNWEYIYVFISPGRGGYRVLTPQIIQENMHKQIKAIK